MKRVAIFAAAVMLSCGTEDESLSSIPDAGKAPDASVTRSDAAPPVEAGVARDASSPPPVPVDSGAPPDPVPPVDSGAMPDVGPPNLTCTFGAPHNGDGSFTWYYFGQGTAQENGYYVTACGYRGTESSNAGQNAVDEVLDVASSGRAKSSYFVAIPSASSSNFDTADECGACVELANGSTKIIATVVDACPKDSNAPCRDPGHLDLSTQAFDALGYSVGNPSNTTWRRVACPVSGNIRARIKNGNTDQVYFTNTVLPIVAITHQGQLAKHLSYGAWQLPNGANASGANLTLTDVEGHVVNGVVPQGGGDMGAQFPSPGSCP